MSTLANGEAARGKAPVPYVAMDHDIHDPVLARLGRIEGRVEEIRDTLAAGASRFQALEFNTRELASAVKTQNGRVFKLEQTEFARQIREATEVGRDEIRRETVLSRRQLAAVIAASSAIPAIVTGVLALREVIL